MEDNSNEIESYIVNLLANLEQAAQKPAKQRKTKVSVVVDNITSVSYQNGLSALALDKLIDLIVLPNELDQSTRAGLVRNLYPVDKISNSIVFRIVASLGHGASKAPYSTQVMLLKWLILTHDVIEDQTVFSQVYSILFNLLDTAAIRLPLCHLLSIITRRRHVRPFRIQLLMELIQQTGSEPALIGLYKVFKVFVPDVIIGQKVDGRSSIFTDLDPDWRGRLYEIQKKAHFLKMQTLATEENGCRLFQRRSAYANKLPQLGLPETESSFAQESSITLDEIDNIQDLVGNLEKIHVPNQLVAMLGDPLFQKFLQLKSSKSDLKRIDNWLLAFFEDNILRRSVENTDVSEMLQLTLEYTRSSKKLPLACELYLNSIIPTWDGLRDRDVILDLLTYTHLDSFKNLFENLLRPLEETVLSDESIDSKLALLKFYTALLYRWTIELLLQLGSTNIIKASIMPLVKHANDLALTTLQNSSSVSTISVVLNFYETVAASTQKIALHSSLSVVLPHPEAIYLLCFTSSLSVLSRIFSVLAIYKRLLDHTPIPGNIKTSISCLNDFNAYLIDICNCIWRDRAFNTKDLNTKGCLLSPLISDALNHYLVVRSNNLVSLESSFNLSFSPVTCLLAKKYFRREENQQDIYSSKNVMADNGPVTRTFLKNLRRLQKEELKIDGIVMSWQDYKLGILDYLKEMGTPGISDLIHSTLTNLSNRPRDK